MADWTKMPGTGLYVGARLYERDPDAIADQLVRRDDHGNFDYFEV